MAGTPDPPAALSILSGPQTGRSTSATLPTEDSLGRIPSPSGRIVAPAPDYSSLTRAVTSFGGDVFQAGQVLQKGWEATQLQDATSAYLKFKSDTLADYDRVTQGTKPGDAQGFATSYATKVGASAKQFLDGLPDFLKPQFGDKVFAEIGDPINKNAIGFEHSSQKTYATNGLNAALDQSILPRARAAALLPENDPSKQPTLDQIIADGTGLIQNSPFLTPAEKTAQIAALKEKVQTGFAQSLPPSERMRVDPANPDQTVSDRIVIAEGTGANPNSTAAGYGQFLDTTWREMLGRYHPELIQGKSNAEIDALRADPGLAGEMVQRYATENANYLKEHGIDPNAGNVYLAHFLGPAGAAAMLSVSPNLPAASVNPAAAKANPEVFYELGADGKPDFAHPKNVGAIVDWAASKMGKAVHTNWGTSLDAIPFDTKIAIAKDGGVAFVAQQTKQKQAKADAQNAWNNAAENAVQDGTFGLTELQQALDSGALTDAGERQRLHDKIVSRDKDGLNLAAASAKINYTGPGKYVFSPSNPDDKNTVKAWYGAAAPDGGAHLLNEQQPDLAGGGNESMVGRPVAGNPNGPAQQAQAAAVYATDRTGIVPPQVVDQLQGGIRSGDPALRQRAFQFMSALTRQYPGAALQAFTEPDQQLLERYTSLAPMLSPDELAKAMNPVDPETKTIHDKLVKDAATAATGIDFLGLAFGKPGWFGTTSSPALPADPMQAQKFQQDGNTIFAESYADTYGNVDAAKKLTATRLARKWGPTDIGSGGPMLMAYPPERSARPGADGTFHWMDDQLEATVKAAVPDWQQHKFQWGISESPQTEAEIKSGQQPHYLVWYTKDGALTFMGGSDGKPTPKRFDYAEGAKLSAADAATKQAAFASRQAADVARQDAMASDPERRALPAGGAGQYLIPPDPGTIPDVQSGPSAGPPGATSGATAPPGPAGVGGNAAAGGLDFSTFGPNAANVQTVVEGGMAASGRTARQVLDDPQYRSVIIDKGWATEPQIDGIVNAPQRPKNTKDARVADAAGQFGLPGVAPSDSPLGAIANMGGAVAGAAQNVWNGFAGSRVVQQFMSGWDNPQGVNRKGKGDKLPVGPLPASPAAMSTAVEEFSDKRTFAEAYGRYFDAKPTEGLTQEMIIAAAQRAQAKDAVAKSGKAVSGGVEGLNAFLNLMLIINQGMAESAAKKAGR